MNVFIFVNHIFQLIMYLFYYYYTLKYTNSQIKMVPTYHIKMVPTYHKQEPLNLWKIIKIKN